MSIVERALSKYEKDKSHWGDIYRKGQEDLRFLSDDQFAQWDMVDASKRADSSRPVLTLDQLSQFVHQVVNDVRMNTPTINVIPAGNNASVDTAEIYKGLIRNIEYKSQADDAYDCAINSSVRSSIGFILVDHEYESDDSFNQDLCIRRVVDPFAITIDSDSVEVDGRDAKHGHIIESISVAEFKEKWGNKSPVSFGDSKVKKEPKDTDMINICKYYEIEETSKEKALLEDGTITDFVEGVNFKVKRTIKVKKVKSYLLSGVDELESGDFPGSYIPIVPVYGEEMWIEGKRNLYSLIRKSKDAQKMFNYWKSLETELLMKQPQAPIMAAEGQIEDYAADWKNPAKAMALRYKTTDAAGNPVGAPQRLEPPVIPTGIVNAAQGCVENIKATLGMYNASIGLRSNETSGIAIQRRQEEGSVATYHFADNLNKSIAHVGRIISCAIPEVYDSSRVIRIIDEEENPQEVGINGLMLDKQEMEYDLRQGKYDVRVTVGAAYTTRRQEAAEFFTSIVTKQPELMQVMGDLLFKYMDFTGAQAMSERMKKLIDPKLLNEESEVDPEKLQLQEAIQKSEMVIGELTTRLQQMEQELKSKQAELMIKAKSEENKADVEAAKLQIEQLKLQIEQQKLQLEQEKLANERFKIDSENQYKMSALALKDKEISQRPQVQEVNEVTL